MGQYDKALALALRLITKKGRPVTIRRVINVTADATKPWKKTGSTNEDHATVAVEIPFASEIPEGVKRTRDDKKFIVAASGLEIDLTPSDFLVDQDGTVYSIQNPIPVRPGDATVIWDVMVRKCPPRSNS